jgi:hypothetical protein
MRETTLAGKFMSPLPHPVRQLLCDGVAAVDREILVTEATEALGMLGK